MRYITVAAAALFISCAAHDAAFAGQDLPGAENMQEPPMEWFYDELDRNNDGLIDKEEFYAGYRDSGLFDDWDSNEDGFLVEDELGEGLYDYWDANDDGFIGKDEIEAHGFWDW